MRANMKSKRHLAVVGMLALAACLVLGRAAVRAQDAAATEAQETAPVEGQDAASEALDDTSPGIAPKADRILLEMSDYLGAAPEFTFHSEVSYDTMLSTGQMVQYGGTSEVFVRRPDRLRAEYHGDERRSKFVYDGKTITILDLNMNLYAITEVPPDIDGAVDHIFEVYGFSVPIADLVYADPYQTVIEFVETGTWVGVHSIDGTPCNHLAFTQESIDWQIWVEDGPRPVPRKLVITYKDEPGAPQYTARLSAWDMQPNVADSFFKFHPPHGATEIEFLPLEVETPLDTQEVDE